VTAFVLLFTGLGAYSHAEGVNVADVMQMQRAQLQADRKAIIAQTMALEPGQSDTFWSVYDDYAAERNKAGDRMQKLVLEYAKNYPSVPDDVARQLMDDWLDIEKERLHLKTRYVRKFRTVLTPQQTVRYFQTENKLDAIVNFGLAADIPLMEKK
jgi:hypothetical protein